MTTPIPASRKNINLNNLNKRISNLETVINMTPISEATTTATITPATTTPATTTISPSLNVINSINNAKTTSKNSAINNFIQKFISEFTAQNIENDLGTALKFTVNFVETNASTFEAIIESALTGTFKTQLVIDLLDQVLDDIPIVGQDLESIINQFFNISSSTVNTPTVTSSSTDPVVSPTSTLSTKKKTSSKTCNIE